MCFYLAAYVNSLYCKTSTVPSLPYQHQYAELFYLYAQLLADLAVEPLESVDIKLRIFEQQLLRSLGYQYNFAKTVHGVPIEPDKKYLFIPGQGLLETKRCIAGGLAGSLADGFSGAVLLRIACNDFAAQTTRQQAKYMMRIAVQHLIGHKRLKSRKLFISER